MLVFSAVENEGERRRRDRREVAAVASFGEGDDVHVGVIRDISLSGMRVLCNAKLAVGDELPVEIQFSQDPDIRCFVDAKVVRVDRLSQSDMDVWHYSVAFAFDGELVDNAEDVDTLAERLFRSRSPD